MGAVAENGMLCLYSMFIVLVLIPLPMPMLSRLCKILSG